MEQFYRFVVGDKGIYEAVESDCPKDDKRRKNKPDGSWLIKIGENYPGAISFWTKNGLNKYLECGLMKWHGSVVKEDIEVIIINRPDKILYEDEYQIILNPEELKVKAKIKLKDFLKNIKNLI